VSQLDIGKVPVEVHCPKCGRRQLVTFHQVGQRKARCTCGVQFTPSRSLAGDVHKVNRQLEDFRRSLQRLLK
jgi:hypothetical protein